MNVSTLQTPNLDILIERLNFNEEEDLDKENFNNEFQFKLSHLIEDMDNLDQILDTFNFEGSNELVQF